MKSRSAVHPSSFILHPSVLIAFFRIFSVASVVVCGLLLGRVLTSAAWTDAITVVGLIVVMFVLAVRPVAGLFLWLILSPYAPFIYLNIELGAGIPVISLHRLATVLLLVQLLGPAVLRARAQGRLGLARVTWPDLAILAFLAALGLTIPSSWLGLVNATQTIFDFVVVPFLLYYLARNWLTGERELRAVVGVLGFIVTTCGLLAIREQLTGIPIFSPHTSVWLYEYNLHAVLSLFGAPAYMAMALAVPAPFLLWGVSQARRPSVRLVLALVLVVDLLGLFLTYVRAGWLDLLAGFAVLFVLSARVRRAVLPFTPVAAIVGIVLVGATIVNPTIVQKRLTSERPLEYRFEALSQALNIIRLSPITGMGYDNFGHVAKTLGWNPDYFRFRGQSPAPHNSYVFVTVSGGVLALLPFLGVFATLVWRGRYFWRRRVGRDLVAVLWGMMLGYVGAIATFDILSAQYVNMLFYLIIGAVLGRLERLEREGRI